LNQKGAADIVPVLRVSSTDRPEKKKKCLFPQIRGGKKKGAPVRRPNALTLWKKFTRKKGKGGEEKVQRKEGGGWGRGDSEVNESQKKKRKDTVRPKKGTGCRSRKT